MPPSTPPHAAVVTRATRALARTVANRATVRCQQPLVTGSYAVPEPDVSVVTPRADDYLVAHPTTALLVVEVAETSLMQDRLTKGPLYAAAGIPEYWIVDLTHDCIEVHRRPDRTRALYAAVTVARRGAHLDLQALAGASVAVADVLPPQRLLVP